MVEDARLGESSYADARQHSQEPLMNNLSRRGFLQRSLAGLTVGAGLPAWYAQQVIAAEEEKNAEAKKAADRITVGCIGIGSPASRGLAIMGDAKGKKGVEIIAVCDIEKNHLENAAKKV